MKRTIGKNKVFLGFAALFAVCVAGVFWGTWGLDVAPVEPDQPTTYPLDWFANYWRGLVTDMYFVPFDLFVALGVSPYFMQELNYAGAAFLAALGMAFYLKGRGVSEVARWGAAFAYALMGYGFTLFSAGHLGWFKFLMCGPFMFGLIDRGVRKGKWRNWALLGGVCAWSEVQQPDVWGLFMLLGGAYGIYALVRERGRNWGRTLAGAGLSLLVTGVIAATSFYNVFTVTLASRYHQIAAGTGAVSSVVSDADAQKVKVDDEKRYEFCTNWSLPPEDMLEFFIPDVHGGSSDPRVSPQNPYRGRLGMKVGPNQWQPYRQHSVYFGVITCLLAILGAVVGFKKDRDVRFWLGATLATLVLALGGFTPFYRIVFMFPIGNSIRCPVKFLHLTEWCVGVLAAFGLQGIIAWGKAHGKQWALVVAALVAGVGIVDLARVAARYCAVEDVSFQRGVNHAAEDVLKEGGGPVAIIMPPQEGQHIVANSFSVHLAPTADRDHPPRFYFVTGNTFREQPSIKQAIEARELIPVGTYSLSRAGISRTSGPSGNTMLLKSAKKPAPPPEAPKQVPLAKRLLAYLSSFTTLTLLGWAIYGCRSRKR